MSKIAKSKDDKIFDTVINILSIITIILVAYPIWFVVIASFSDPMLVNEGEVWFWPKGITLDSYGMLLKTPQIWVGYRNTIMYTLFGTMINIFLTTCAAFPLSRQDMPARKFFTKLVTFTMLFGGGIIPTYLVVKELGMTNNIWSMLVPGAIVTYNLIVMKTFFQNSIPYELQEAASIDGCSDFKILTNVILPLSKPIMAIMVLFYAVGHWNSYFDALIYLKNKDLFPLQIILREILLQNSLEYMDASAGDLQEQVMLAETMKYSVIIVASLPVLAFYPFVQKYFVKGVMVGAVKG